MELHQIEIANLDNNSTNHSINTSNHSTIFPVDKPKINDNDYKVEKQKVFDLLLI
jgi:hypothetical protein